MMTQHWMRCAWRRGGLLLVAGWLLAIMTGPGMADDRQCPTLWQAIPIVSVTPVMPVITWHAHDLLSYGDGRTDNPVSVGELDVVFTPLARTDFSGYRVTATPSEDDPGTSAALGIEAETRYVSHADAYQAVRLNLEPGTKYYIEVVAVNPGLGDTWYLLSEAQGNQDNLMAVTYLSPPFPGAHSDIYIDAVTNAPSNLADMDLPAPGNAHQGTHFLVYQLDEELHSFRWLNPEIFGPFDHVWQSFQADGDHYYDQDFARRLLDRDNAPGTPAKGADILCTDNEGVVDACPAGGQARRKQWDLNTYRVQVARVGGQVEYQQDVSVLSSRLPLKEEQAIIGSMHYYYEVFFHLDPGVYDFTVQAGRKDGNTFRAMSGKAVVRFDIPGDYRQYNQSIHEWIAIVDEVARGIDEDSDRPRWFAADNPWNYYYPGPWIKAIDGQWVIDTDNPFQAWSTFAPHLYRTTKIIAHLNNIYD